MVGIETGIDRLLDLIQEKKEITVREAARKLKVTESKIESWGKILSDENIIELTYPANPLNPPFLRAVSAEELKKKEEQVKEEKPKKKTRRKRSVRKRVKGAKVRSSKFFSRFRSRKKGKRSLLLPYAAVLIVALIAILYFTGVIGWLTSLLSP